MQQGSIYNVRLEFKVNYDIAYGLKYCNVVKKHGFLGRV